MVSPLWMIDALARLISHSGIITADDFKVQLDEAPKLVAMTNDSRNTFEYFVGPSVPNSSELIVDVGSVGARVVFAAFPPISPVFSND